MRSKKTNKKAVIGRPSEGLTEVLYVRITPELSTQLESVRTRFESETGLALKKADIVRMLLTQSLRDGAQALRGKIEMTDESQS